MKIAENFPGKHEKIGEKVWENKERDWNYENACKEYAERWKNWRELHEWRCQFI